MKVEIRHISFFCAESSPVKAGRWRAAAKAALALLALASSSIPLFAHAQSDDDFMVAREAFRTGNRAKLDSVAPRLRDHALNDYVLYWQMRQRIEEADSEDIRALLARLADGPLGDRLRNDWLSALGRRGMWALFHAEHRGLRHEDADVACYALRRRVSLGEADALRAARMLWLASRPAPESCTPVFETAMDARIITQADVWSRIRLSLEQAQPSAAKRVAGHLTAKEGFEPKALDAAGTNPGGYLERHGSALKGRGAREIAMYALQRMARNGPQEAVRRWQTMAASFPAEERQ